jgi:hypothetical protein
MHDRHARAKHILGNQVGRWRRSVSNRRVLLFQQRNWALNIGHELAKRLQAEGDTLAALTFKATTDRFVRTQSDVHYERIDFHDGFWNDPYIIPGVAETSLETVCAGLQIPSIWPLANGERHFVRSYGDKYFYSFRQNRSDEDLAAYVKACYLVSDRLLTEFKPDVIVAPNFASTIHLIAQRLAEVRGIPMLALVASKIQGMQVGVTDYNYASGPFIDRIRALNDGLETSENLDLARRYIEEFRSEFKQPTDERWEEEHAPLKRRVLDELRVVKRIINFYRRGPENEIPLLGPTIDSERPRIILRNHFTHKRNRRAAQRFPYARVEDLNRIVYLPLQFQPEQAIDVVAPYFNNQIETARLVAQSLPGDYTLAVKEHPAMLGKRQRSYYEKLARTPNVKLIDYRVRTEAIMRKADLIVTPVGTSIAEAAFYHLPVIQLGNLGFTLELPNVFHHTDLTTLASRIGEVLSTDFGNADYEHKLEHFVAAAYDVGVPVRFLSVKRGHRSTELEQLCDTHLKDIDSLVSARRALVGGA